MSVGKSIPRVDGLVKVTGKAQYVDDIFEKDMLYAKVFRSAIANGWVKSIDTAAARALPGVAAVVTYEDVPEHSFATAGHPYNLDPARRDVADRRLLNRRVRLYGDEIAAVVAVDEFTAEKALSLISVEYEEYPPVLTAEDALREGAAEIHKGTKNIIASTNYRLGDVEEAFARSDYVFEDSYSTSTVQHCAMENHTAYAYIDNNGKIAVVTSTQIPHIARRIVGEALGIPWGRVRVIKPYVGGGFGSKQDAVVEPLAAFLTTRVQGRPVRLQLTREETFIASRVRHAISFTFRTGVSKEGALIARRGKAVSLNGGYASHGHSIAANGGNKYRQIYDQQAIQYEALTVYTNMPSAGAMRGYGIPQMTFALECHMEDVAREIGMDPIEFRLKNIVRQGWVDPLTGIRVNTSGLAECMAKGKELIQWDAKKKELENQTGPKRRGLGMANFVYASGTHPIGLEIAGARIIMNEDGSVQVQVGATEIGQGSDTVFCQMAAETIGLPTDRVFIVTEQDTDVSPVDLGSYASRQTYVTGMAVKKAAEEIKAKTLDYARFMTDIPVGAMDIADGWIVYRHDGERIMTVAEVALNSWYNPAAAAPITADVTHNARVNALAFGCTFVEVEVDLPLGKVEVREIYNIHDSGKVMNPKLAAGQVRGGVSMGLGYALYEQMLFDPKTGKPLNANLLDYKLMTAMDTPEIGVEFIEPFEPSAPYGNKALGEPPAITPAPAIRNAILAATGVKFNQLPMTPQRLVEKFKAAGLIRKNPKDF